MKNIYYGLFNRKKHNKKDVHQNNSLKKELSLLTQGMTSKNINNNQSDFTGMSMVFDRNRNNNNIIIYNSIIHYTIKFTFCQTNNPTTQDYTILSLSFYLFV